MVAHRSSGKTTFSRFSDAWRVLEAQKLRLSGTAHDAGNTTSWLLIRLGADLHLTETEPKWANPPVRLMEDLYEPILGKEHRN